MAQAGAGASAGGIKEAKDVQKASAESLVEFCVFHSIEPAKGTGASGNVVKADRVKAATKFFKEQEKEAKKLKEKKDKEKEKTEAKRVKPRTTLSKCPEMAKDFASHRVWLIEAQDWEKKGLHDGHTEEDLYEEMKKILTKDDREDFIVTSEERTYATLKAWINEKFSDAAAAMGEEDKQAYQNYVRGNDTFADARKNWFKLRTKAIKSGRLKPQEDDYLTLLSVMDLAPKDEAGIRKEIIEKEVKHKEKADGSKFDPLEVLVEILKLNERVYAEAKIRQKNNKNKSTTRKRTNEEAHHGDEENKGESGSPVKKKKKSKQKWKDGGEWNQEQAAWGQSEEAQAYWGKGFGKGKGKDKGKDKGKGLGKGKGFGKGKSRGPPLCRYGATCTRPDCWYQHPRPGLEQAMKGLSLGGKGKSKGAGKGGANVWLDGDWECPQCKHHNFAKNKECFKCKGVKREPSTRPNF